MFRKDNNTVETTLNNVYKKFFKQKFIIEYHHTNSTILVASC